MKMARDRLGALRRRGVAAELATALGGGGDRRAESWLALKLGRAMEAARREGGGAVARVWDEQWETVYGLADAICARHLEGVEGGSRGFPEKIIARL